MPNPLPPSNDSEYWEEAEVQKHTPVKVDMCLTHTKENWATHKGYIQNPDGSISCKFCPWGTAMPGYMRLKEDRVVDLRSIRR